MKPSNFLPGVLVPNPLIALTPEIFYNFSLSLLGRLPPGRQGSEHQMSSEVSRKLFFQEDKKYFLKFDSY